MSVPPGDAGARKRTDARPTHGTVVFIDLAGFAALTANPDLYLAPAPPAPGPDRSPNRTQSPIS